MHLDGGFDGVSDAETSDGTETSDGSAETSDGTSRDSLPSVPAFKSMARCRQAAIQPQMVLTYVQIRSTCWQFGPILSEVCAAPLTFAADFSR